MVPSFFSSLFRVQRRESTRTITGAISAINRSKYELKRNGRGATNADIPRIMRIFIILDPTTLPTAISAFPRRAARIEVIISGALVPTATIVRPIIDSESPAIFARSTAQVTRIFPQKKSTQIPHATQSQAFQGESIFSTTSDSSGTILLCLSE